MVDFAKVIVGHTTPFSATLWFCLHGIVPPGYHYVCEIGRAMPPDFPKRNPPTGKIDIDFITRPQILPVTFDPARANTAVLVVNNLQPATEYRFVLRLRREGQADVPGKERAGRVVAKGEFTTAPADSGSLSLVFGSCHRPNKFGETSEDAHKTLERWMTLANREDYDLMLLIGDQIYGEEIEKYWPGDDKYTWFDRYVNRYHQFWTYRPVRQVLRRTPTYMVLDDHEVLDDWGTKTIEAKDGGDERVQAGVTAYKIFQHAHNPGGYDEPIHYSFRRGPASFFVMDGRSVRSVDAKNASFPILGSDQYKALQDWARSEETRAADVVFFVAPTPIAFLPVDEILRLVRQLPKAASEAGALVGWLVGGIPGAAVGWYVGREVAESKIKEEGLADLTEHDLADLWTYEPNQKDLSRVLNCLFNLANDVQADGSFGPRPRAVFVLGGDVHSGSMHLIASHRQQTPHVCALTVGGRLWHMIRGADGKWSPFGDVKAEILREYPRSQNPGFFLNVDCVGIRGELHVIGLTQTRGLGRTQTNLVHTIRFSPTEEFPNGRWQQWAQILPQRNAPSYVSSIKSASCARVEDKLHVCVITSDGQLWHGVRHPYVWGWEKTAKWPTGYKPTPIKGVSCAGFAADLHVCAIANDGRLWHTIRRTDGKWASFGDVKAAVLGDHPGSPDPDSLLNTSCSTGIGGELHVCAIIGDGTVWHTIRWVDGPWTAFGDVRAEVLREHPSFPDPGPLFNVKCSIGIAGELHVCAVTGDGRLFHTIRRADGTWSPFEFKAIDTEDMACASVAGERPRNPVTYQLTSSPISNEPATHKIYEKVVRHIREGKDISSFDLIRAGGDFGKIVEHEFGDEKALFPLDNRLERNHWAEFVDLLVERNFGRISVERAPGDRRIYRFYLTVEGQASSLRRAMEIDLDAHPVIPKDISNGLGILGLRGSLTSLQVHPNAAWIDGWNFSKDDNAIRGVGDLNGDGIDEFIITSDWGIGVLYHDGDRWRQAFAYPNDTWFGGWRYDSRYNRIERLGDFDGDRSIEVLITSDWGIGILKQRENTFDSLIVQPNGTWFGGWNYDSRLNRITGIGNFDGDREGKAEILITSDWGIGVLALQENTLVSLVTMPNDSWFGGWRYDSRYNRIEGLGDFDGDGKVEILITSDWGIGILKQEGDTFVSPVIHPAGTRFGGWLYSGNDRISGVGDFDGDGKVEILITSGWGIGILKQEGDTFVSSALMPSGSRFGGWLYDSSNIGVTQLNGAIFRHGCLPRLDSISSRRYSGPS